MTNAPVVLVVGCGVAGPVLGNLLKRKGYQPIVFEKVSKLGDAGSSLMLMSNGLKVLDLVGVAADVSSESSPLEALYEATAAGETLGISQAPSYFKAKYGQPAAGVRRTSLNLRLKQKLLDVDVDVREGWELERIEEAQDSVTAFFNGGRVVKGSFLIGCDGIKSVTRRCVLAFHGLSEGIPTYTGLTQTAGIAETPAALKFSAAMRNWYGDGIHVIAYPISSTHTSFAISRREKQEREETWRPYREEEMASQKVELSHLLKGWDSSVLKLVSSSEKLIKFGLFDRDELTAEHWYSKRCILVGDAAHPTSPHLGQGANQALEDCYHLSHLIPHLIPGNKDYESLLKSLGSGLSENFFKPFADSRQPRTSELVKGARVQGEARVASGDVACQKRDAAIVQFFEDPSSVEKKFEGLLREPFL